MDARNGWAYLNPKVGDTGRPALEAPHNNVHRHHHGNQEYLWTSHEEPYHKYGNQGTELRCYLALAFHRSTFGTGA